MPSSEDHFGAARREVRPRVPRWAAALAAALAAPPARAAEAGPPPMQPTPFRTPLNWGDLPAPTALVHVNTPVGAFTLPMGYLSNWFVLRDEPVATAPDGLRQFSGQLVYQFEYPGGGMNANTPFVRAVRDAAGRVVAGRTVVYVDPPRSPDRDGEDLAAATLGRYPPGTLAHNAAFSTPEHEVLDGTAPGSGPSHRIGVHVSCEIDCHFDLYLEDQRLILSGLMDGRLRHDGLAVAEQAQALFEHWQTAPAKGD